MPGYFLETTAAVGATPASAKCTACSDTTNVLTCTGSTST